MKTLSTLVVLLTTLLFFSSCNNETAQWARIGVEAGNNNKEIFRKVPTQFWVSAPEGEEIFVRANKGVFIKDGKEIDAIKGFSIMGIGEARKMYFDVINPDLGDLKIDVSYPSTGTSSLELKDAVNINYIEVAGGTVSTYSEIFFDSQSSKKYLRIHVLGNNIPRGTEFIADYIVNGYMPSKNGNGYIRGSVTHTFNSISGIECILEPLEDRDDKLYLSTFSGSNVAIYFK